MTGKTGLGGTQNLGLTRNRVFWARKKAAPGTPVRRLMCEREQKGQARAFAIMSAMFFAKAAGSGKDSPSKIRA